MYHLIIAAIVIKLYYYPVFYDYSVTAYKAIVPFTKTGIQSVDTTNTLTMFCIPFILILFCLMYYIISNWLAFIRFFYGGFASQTVHRAICINTMTCAAIDILITQVFIGDEPLINIIDLSLRILYGALMWNVVYLPIVICMVIGFKMGKKTGKGEENRTVHLKGTAPPPNDNPYSYP